MGLGVSDAVHGHGVGVVFVPVGFFEVLHSAIVLPNFGNDEVKLLLWRVIIFGNLK